MPVAKEQIQQIMLLLPLATAIDCCFICSVIFLLSPIVNSGINESIFPLLTISPISFLIQSSFFSIGTVNVVFSAFLKLFITPSDSLNEVDTCLLHSAKLLLLNPILLLMPFKTD